MATALNAAVKVAKAATKRAAAAKSSIARTLSQVTPGGSGPELDDSDPKRPATEDAMRPEVEQVPADGAEPGTPKSGGTASSS